MSIHLIKFCCVQPIFLSIILNLCNLVYLDLSWFANANLAAFSWSFANLFSYLETFFRVGLMNFPFMSLTDMFNSWIWNNVNENYLFFGGKVKEGVLMLCLNNVLADFWNLLKISWVNWKIYRQRSFHYQQNTFF